MNKIYENILLIEHSLEFVVESHEEIPVCEEEDSSSVLKLSGVIQKGNVPNGNRRIYKTELLVREDAKFQSKIKSGLAMGKIFHPSFYEQGGASGVTNVSHRFTRTWIEGDIVRGELLIFNTVAGGDVKAIVEGGGKIGISSRGFGGMERFDNVKVGGKTFKDVWVVKDNYTLETYDLVLTPSVRTAFLSPVKESIGVGTNENNEKNNNNEDTGNDFKSTNTGRKTMTIEELKAQHPELYNTVHDAAFKEGKTAGVAEASIGVKAEHDKAIALKETDITASKAEVTVLTVENTKLKTENDALKGQVSVFETDKAKTGIKTSVEAAVKESALKDYIKEEDVVGICAGAKTVEEAKKNLADHIKVIEGVIASHKVKSTGTGTGSITTDTSEANSSNNMDEAKKRDEDFADSQRALAFGGF